MVSIISQTPLDIYYLLNTWIDMSSNRKILKMLLASTGAVIDLAENGQQAVTKVQQILDNDNFNLGGYDIVFMDNLMPVMVGHTYLVLYFRRSKVDGCMCVMGPLNCTRSVCNISLSTTW